MSLVIRKNILLNNPETKPFLADAYYPDGNNLGLIIFAHGYKGYKDWGAWHLMAEKLANAGFYVVKFNFSHNGTTLNDPTNFGDLEAFGHNNYSKEMSDLAYVIDHFIEEEQVNKEQVALMAHSRGNGNIVLQAAIDNRIKAIVGLAGLSDYGAKFPTGEVLEHIKKAGVVYIENTRTNQQMPHYIQFFEDFIANESRFDIKKSAMQLNIPYLICHGTEDATLPLSEAQNLHQWAKNSTLYIVDGGNHNFGATEPWTQDVMPKDLDTVIDEAILFLKKNI